MSYSGQFPITTARFANVAFSNGSLLAGYLERLMKGQPLSCPSDIRRFFVSPQESGQICLLACILGDSGDIFFEDTSLVKMNPAKRAAFRAKRCGFIFQSYHLLPELDVLQNVILPSMAVGNGRDVKARAEELLEKVGLAGRMDHRPMELSGGEQQRVAIARALMNDPDLILADEPTGNLDSHTGENILNNLFDLAQSATRTLIIVTHNDAVARRCQRELVLKDGKLEE
jgi:predicted ABC-type transport system involved in lysophospholipase L1 biosynthesis ATPase subunit